jgi:hypothetical protein
MCSCYLSDSVHFSDLDEVVYLTLGEVVGIGVSMGHLTRYLISLSSDSGP